MTRQIKRPVETFKTFGKPVTQNHVGIIAEASVHKEFIANVLFLLIKGRVVVEVHSSNAEINFDIL